MWNLDEAHRETDILLTDKAEKEIEMLEDVQHILQQAHEEGHIHLILLIK